MAKTWLVEMNEQIEALLSVDRAKVRNLGPEQYQQLRDRLARIAGLGVEELDEMRG